MFKNLVGSICFFILIFIYIPYSKGEYKLIDISYDKIKFYKETYTDLKLKSLASDGDIVADYVYFSNILSSIGDLERINVPYKETMEHCDEVRKSRLEECFFCNKSKIQKDYNFCKTRYSMGYKYREEPKDYDYEKSVETAEKMKELFLEQVRLGNLAAQYHFTNPNNYSNESYFFIWSRKPYSISWIDIELKEQSEKNLRERNYPFYIIDITNNIIKEIKNKKILSREELIDTRKYSKSALSNIDYICHRYSHSICNSRDKINHDLNEMISKIEQDIYNREIDILRCHDGYKQACLRLEKDR